MSKAVKLLVSGYEASGKSTITSTIKDALVINFDRKEYSFAIPHANFKDYEGMDSVIKFVNEKIAAYKKKNNDTLPKVVVFDTVTQMYTAMVGYNSKKYSGFAIHSQNNIDTITFNEYIEKVLMVSGISVVIVAHTIVDTDSGRHIIPANGSVMPFVAVMQHRNPSNCWKPLTEIRKAISSEAYVNRNVQRLSLMGVAA